MSPKVSVIIPTKDREEPLIRALTSVENQSFRAIEVVVVDDHSRKAPSSIIEQFESRLPIRLIPSQGEGVSAARNTGIRATTSEFIALLDSDDEWMMEKISKQVDFFDTHPEIPLVHTEEVWIRNGVRVNPMKKHKKSGGRIFTPSTKLCLISPSATMLRRSLLDEVGLFNESFTVCEDYELWLRVTALYEVGFIDSPLTIKYGGHDDQLSRRYHSMDLWRVRALKNFIAHSALSIDEKEAVKQEIKFKCQVLLKGFEKHRNFEHKEEVESIYALSL